MSRLTPQKYALALYKLLEVDSFSKPQQALKQLLPILQKNRALGMLPKIISNLEGILLKGSAATHWKVYVAHKLSHEKQEHFGQQLSKELGGNVEFQVDESLLGGVRIVGSELEIDYSLQDRLQKLAGFFNNQKLADKGKLKLSHKTTQLKTKLDPVLAQELSIKEAAPLITIVTAHELPEASQAHWQKTLSTEKGAQVEFRVDPEILGGVKVLCAGVELDYSYRRRLSEMQSSL